MKMKNWFVVVLLALGWPILCHAQLNFPTSLRNELDLNPVDASAREVVVLIHGWTGESSVSAGYSRYDDSADAPEMYYLFNILKLKLAGSGRKLVTYHWEKDASTGLVDMNPLNGALVQDAIRNATTAANRAVSHGTHLAELLNDQAPDLRRVQFIAHSAGSWAARQAAIELLNLNPYVVVQVTLLDPYIPGAVPSPWTPTTTLVKGLMDDMIWISGSSRIYRLENYFADDSFTTAQFPTLGTQESFVWRSQDINQQVDHGATGIPGLHLWYDFHSGPLEFYGDTVSASILGNPVPLGLTTLTPSFITLGWYRSLTAESAFLPNITTSPQSQTANPGQSVTLNVVATSSQALTYQWYRNGSMLIGEEGSSYTFTASAGSPATYAVRVSNTTGPIFSEKAVVSVYASVPSISSVSPNTLPPSSSPQLLSIFGSNFKAPADPNPSKLIFYDPAGNPTPLRTPTYVNSGQLDYNATLPVTGTWKVKVVNGVAESLPYSFTVTSGTVQLTGLSITGPGTINENASGQFTAKAIFSDGTTPTVTASWSVSSGPASISSSGLLSASSVNANTTMTVTGSYSTGGITKTTTADVTIVDTGSGGGFELQQLIANANFASGSSGWTLSGNFQADSRFSTCRSCPGYAYLANADGSPGNNLSGTLSQSFTIPANAVEAALDFWHRTTTAETGGAIDRLNVRLRLANNSLVGLADIWNTDANASYGQRSVDLTAYKGQTVTLEFFGTTSASAPTTFRIDDVTLTVTVPTPPTPVSLVISGPSSVVEGGTGQYYATMIYSDGSSGTVSALTWGNNTPSVVSFTSGGLLTAGQVNQDTVVSIYTTANVNGQNYQAYKDVKIVDQPAFTSLAISGPTSMNENSARQFTATANFSDGSAQSVSANWSVSSGPGSISGSGLLTVGELTSDALTTLSASSTIGGTTRSATYQVLVLNTSVPPTLVSLNISGPSSVIENSTAQFTGIANFSDGSSQVVNPTWNLNSLVASVSQFGLFSSGEVSANTLVTLSASYSVGGITRNATNDVAIVDGVGLSSGPYEAKWAVPLNTFRVYASAPAQGGGMVLFGTFTGTITAGGQNLTANGAPSDFYGVKLNASNQVVWVRQFGGANEETVDSCAQHPAGGWAIAGTFQSTASIGGVSLVSVGNRDAYLARVDEDGNVLWAKRGGGSSIDYGKFAGVDGTGNCFLFGLFTTSATFTGGGVTLNATGTRFDIFVAKYSAAGDFLWAKSGGGPEYDDLYCAKVDTAGNAYIGGIFEKQATYGPYTMNVVGSLTDWDAFLAKFAPNGDVLWAKRFGQSVGDTGTESMNFIAPAADGTCFFGGLYQLAMLVDGQALPGRTSWTAFVGKVNSGGTVEWLRSIPAETMYEIGVYFAFSSSERGVTLSDGGLMVAGRYKGKLVIGSTTCTNASSSEYQFLAKFDGAGTAQWAITSGSAGLYYVDSVFPASGDRFRMLARASGQAVSFPGITPVSATAEDAVLVEFGSPENPPFINMTLVGDKVILTWPATSSGFALEWATNLPPSNWTSNSVVPVVVSGNLNVTNPISGPMKFFRLKK